MIRFLVHYDTIFERGEYLQKLLRMEGFPHRSLPLAVRLRGCVVTQRPSPLLDVSLTPQGLSVVWLPAEPTQISEASIRDRQREGSRVGTSGLPAPRIDLRVIGNRGTLLSAARAERTLSQCLCQDPSYQEHSGGFPGRPLLGTTSTRTHEMFTRGWANIRRILAEKVQVPSCSQ